MNENLDRQLALQPDIYQRYAFLAGLTQVLVDAGSETVRVLDVGCGPVRLTEMFLGPRFHIARADVEPFGDPDIVLVVPGQSLPFETGTFDLVLALDVLEHLPQTERPNLVRELQRLARVATIVCCPVATAENIDAERDFSEWAKAVSGRDIDFLLEHQQYGLPSEAEVASWFDRSAKLIVAKNSPLEDWLAFNLFDLIYAADFGDADAKQRLNVTFNARARFQRSGVAHYRRFFCAVATQDKASAVETFIEHTKEPAPFQSRELIRQVISAVVTMRKEMLSRFAVDLASKDAALKQLDEYVSGLHREVAGFQQALEEKDTHVRKLDDHLHREVAAFQHALEQKDRHIRKVDDRLHREVGALQRALDEKDVHIRKLDDHVSSLNRRIESLQGVVQEKDARTVALAAKLAERDAEAARLSQDIADLVEQVARDFASVRELATYIRQADEAIGAGPTVSAHGTPFDEARQAAEVLREEAVVAHDTLRQTDAALSETRAELDNVSSYVGEMEAQLRAVLRSHSWRVTAPFRLLRRSLQGLAHAAPFSRLWHRAIEPLRERLNLRRILKTAVQSGVFDADWYRATYPDVAASGVDPFVHYLKRGAAEGRDPHPLFDSSFYVEANPDVAAAGVNPLVHYLSKGALEGRDPHPDFDSSFYLASNPDVLAAGVNPLAHYLSAGAAEGRDPHPLFDSSFYLEANPDVVAAGDNPLVHYLSIGSAEGRDPHPLFNSTFYLATNPDVVAAGVNPLGHYLSNGALEGRDPHPLFDSSFYLAINPDVAAAGINPLVHYLSSGAREERDPHPDFDTSFYLASNPDVLATGVNPLMHFVLRGKDEGRVPCPDRIETASTEALYVPPVGLLPWFNPLNLRVSAQLSSEPRLNVLVPGLGMRHLSGGPNTALALVGRLALAGIRVRLISTDAPLDDHRGPFWVHMRGLLGAELPAGIELVDAHNRSVPLTIGDRDVFMATAWWTAQQAKYALKLTKHQRFVYLIQDYEPLLHPASTQQALAVETYALDHIPVINSEWLYEFLIQQRVGRFANRRFAGQALVFQPAVDRGVFHPRESEHREGRRRLLFYTRPTNGLRNLFELGVAALQKAIADGIFNSDQWEFVGMGESFTPLPLGQGATLTPAPWLDLAGYARQMRESDILLSLMLSPHPSYPPLEIAASGGLCVTTAFANKTAERLGNLSANILATDPTVEGVAEGLARAHARLAEWDRRIESAEIELPQTWDESFAEVAPALVTRLFELQGSPALSSAAAIVRPNTTPAVHPAFRSWPTDEYEVFRRERLARRVHEYPAVEQPGLISFLTPVWNTNPAQLEELAESVLGQDIHTNYEWVVLDNGSDSAETSAVLERLARDPRVRLYRSPENLGIIGGTRLCLERATGRYAATVDHDDLLAPDCVRVLTHALVGAEYPPLAYTDEDKVDGHNFCGPYFKPDWDPVLFSASCYIAHLIAFDRERALEFGAYTDAEAEGSHDWDTFMRFAVRGIVPFHIPEVLYTWRIHALSTAGNIHSKPYVFWSQRHVLNKFVTSSPNPDWYELEHSPLFDGTPDWRIRRKGLEPRPITTVVVGGTAANEPWVALGPGIPHEVVVVPDQQDAAALAALVARCADERRLVHMLWAGTQIDGSEWPWEAMAQFELFPDTAIVGGRVLRNRRVLSAASYFGFGRGCDSPDRGRSVDDPGYFCQMWKPHSASAVPVQHCVIESSFFHDFLSRYKEMIIPMRQLGAWLGAFARTRDRRVVYTPFLSARATVDVEAFPDSVEWTTFRRVHTDLIPERNYLSSRLGLDKDTAYRGVAEGTRRTQLVAGDQSDGAVMLAADRAARRILLSGGARHTTFSLLTSVYVRTPARLFELTKASALSQQRPFDEWVLLVNGPVTAEVEEIVTGLSGDPRITVIRESTNVGIVGAMRRCLEGARSEYVLPLDADDLLEPDALKVLEAVLGRHSSDVVYADEDILSGDDVLAQFSRPPFDPVLNVETSYIWHPCAFRSARALELGVYSDSCVEYCHDWDTVTRFALAGARIDHVPHVLYHWRTHAASQSHSGTQNEGSIASTRHLLQALVAKQPHPELYEVRPFPVFRGAEEWYIARRPEAPPVMDLVVLTGEDASTSDARRRLDSAFPFRQVSTISTSRKWSTALADIGNSIDASAQYVAIVSDRYQPIGSDWPWEAICLLELHEEVVVVGGRVVDDRGIIRDAGRRLGAWSRGLNDFAGLHRTDAGSFALALKAHTIDEPCEALLVVNAAFLQAAIEFGRQRVPLPLGRLLAATAAVHDRRMAYSPMLEVTLAKPEQAVPLMSKCDLVSPESALLVSGSNLN